MNNKKISTWGGKRVPSKGKKLGAPVRQSKPEFVKKFRASAEEKEEFLSLLTGNARKDFLIVLDALRNKEK